MGDDVTKRRTRKRAVILGLKGGRMTRPPGSMVPFTNDGGLRGAERRVSLLERVYPLDQEPPE